MSTHSASVTMCLTRDGRMCMAALKPGDVAYVAEAMRGLCFARRLDRTVDQSWTISSGSAQGKA